MIRPLKHWCLNRTLPSIDDTESLSVLELVGKNTTKINEIVKDYNNFVDKINETIEEFENGINSNFECFRNKIIKIMHDYIIMIDEKIKLQDSVIDNAVKYMKTNLRSTITELIVEMRENGQLSEDIMTALNDFTVRLNTLENSFKSFQDLNLDNRVTTLENTDYQFIFTESSRNLTVEKTVKEVEVNE